MKKYIIDEETLKGIVGYLMGRPYAEVWQGLERLKQLKEIPQEEKVADEKTS